MESPDAGNELVAPRLTVAPDARQPVVKLAADVIGVDGFHDPLFDQVHKHAEDSGVTVFGGYLGYYNGVDNVRLYLSLDFSDYVDIPKDCVVVILDLRTPADPLAGQAVWVKLDAQITHGTTGVKKQALRDGIMDGDISSLRNGDGGQRPGGRMTPSPWCGGRMSPSPWCGGRMSPRPWC